MRLFSRGTAIGVEIPRMADAYAESGRFPEAIQTLRRAIDLATTQNQAGFIEELQARIRLYETGTPYRDSRAEGR